MDHYTRGMAQASSADGLVVQRDGPVVRVLLDRPERRNALTQSMWASIPGLMEQLGDDERVRLIVWGSSTPGVFSAGADITEYRDHASDLDWSARSQKVVAAALEAVAHALPPTLAVIDGPCFGGGAGLAVACDFRIATRRSTFAITPARLGMVYPFTATVALVDLVGARAAKRILFTGETMDSDVALEIGLVDRLTEADDLQATVTDYIEPLLSASGGSARLMKQAIRMITDGDRDSTPTTDGFVEQALASSDYHEGVTAFLERRPPRFGGDTGH